MCQTEAIVRDLSLMKRLSAETGSLPLCRCSLSPILMSLQTPGTTYHPLTASLHLILLLHNLLALFLFLCLFIFVSSTDSYSFSFMIMFLFFILSPFLSQSRLSSTPSFRNWQKVFNLTHISSYDNLHRNSVNNNIVSSLQIPETWILVIN